MTYTDEHWALAERYETMRTFKHQVHAWCPPSCPGYSPHITTDALIHILLSEGYVVEYSTDFYQLGTKGYWIQFTHDDSDAPMFQGETHQEALIQAVLFDMAVDDEMEAKTNE